MTAGRFGRGESSDLWVRRGVDGAVMGLVLLLGTNYGVVAEDRYSVPSLVPILAAVVLGGLLYEARATQAAADRPTTLLRHLVEDPRPGWWAVVAFGSYALVLLASSLGARDSSAAVAAGLTWVTAIPMVAAITLASAQPRRFRLVIHSVVVVLLVLAAPTVIQRLTGTYSFDWYGLAGAVQANINGDVQWRSQGTTESNAFGAWLVIYLPIGLLAVRLAHSTLLRALALLSIVFATGAVLSTYSRGPLIGLVAITLPLMIWLSGRQRRLLGAGLALVALGLAVVAPRFWTDQIDNLAEVSSALQGDVAGGSSTAGHLSTFRAGLYMFGDHPLLGVGARNFIEHYGDYVDRIGLDTSGKARSAHSAYAQIPAETGLAGIVVVGGWVAVLAASVVRALRRLPSLRSPEAAVLTALGVSLVGHAVTSVFRSTSHPQAGWIVIALVLAVLSSHQLNAPAVDRLTDRPPSAPEPTAG